MEMPSGGGSSWWAEVSAYPMKDETGAVTGVIEHLRDVTEQVESNRKLTAALQEKDDLMRELNHRVKNNLGMVSSLLSLKDESLGPRIDLSDVRNQIDAIQTVHQKLYEAGEVSRVNPRDYIRDLLDTVFASFYDSPVTVDIRIPDTTVHTKTAVCLGLITNELATNAIKHGFSEDRSHRFSVSMDRDATGWTYSVFNDGRPFPEDIGFDHGRTLGLQLIASLAEQLGARVEVHREPSPTFIFRAEHDPS
jgi:two-component sensor histidine kinase